jgi:hypothetical protein
MYNGPFEVINALDFNQIEHLVEVHQVPMYLMAALLSATAKSCFCLGYELLVSRLNLAKAGKIKKIFWPSSIAVFGPTTPKKTRQIHDHGAVYRLWNQ